MGRSIGWSGCERSTSGNHKNDRNLQHRLSPNTGPRSVPLGAFSGLRIFCRRGNGAQRPRYGGEDVSGAAVNIITPPIWYRRAKARRDAVTAAERYASAVIRRDTREIHAAREGMQRATTARLECGA